MQKLRQILNTYKYEVTVFFFFVFSRLPSLGNDNFNTDVWKWKTRAFNFGGGVFGLDFKETLQFYHPGVVLMWLGAIGVKFYNLYYEVFFGGSPPDNDVTAIFGLDFTQKLFVVLVIALTISAIFYVLRTEFSVKYATVFTLLVIFEPFYLGLTRVFHLEGLMSTFMLAAVVWFYYFLKHPTHKKYLFVSAMFTALAVLTKTSALFLLAFCGLALVLDSLRNGKTILSAITQALKPFAFWLFSGIFVFILLWPAVWVTPVAVFQTLVSGIFDTGVATGHEQFYFSKYVLDPGPTFYFVVFLFKSSIYLLAGLVGYAVTNKKFADSKIKDFAYYILLFAILYAVLMTLPSKKLDRYLLPTILSLLLVVSFFYTWLLSTVSAKLSVTHKRFKNKTKAFLVVLIVFFVPAAVNTIFLHPDYFSYYNPLLGGLYTGMRVIEPKWLIGQRETIDYLTTVKQQNNYVDFPAEASVDEYLYTDEINNMLVVGFPEKYYTQIWPFVKRIGGRAVIKEIRGFAEVANYFVYPVWEDDSELEDRFELEYVGDIKIRGVPAYRVYQKVK